MPRLAVIMLLVGLVMCTAFLVLYTAKQVERAGPAAAPQALAGQEQAAPAGAAATPPATAPGQAAEDHRTELARHAQALAQEGVGLSEIEELVRAAVKEAQ